MGIDGETKLKKKEDLTSNHFESAHENLIKCLLVLIWSEHFFVLEITRVDLVMYVYDTLVNEIMEYVYVKPIHLSLEDALSRSFFSSWIMAEIISPLGPANS